MFFFNAISQALASSFCETIAPNLDDPRIGLLQVSRNSMAGTTHCLRSSSKVAEYFGHFVTNSEKLFWWKGVFMKYTIL